MSNTGWTTDEVGHRVRDYGDGWTAKVWSEDESLRRSADDGLRRFFRLFRPDCSLCTAQGDETRCDAVHAFLSGFGDERPWPSHAQAMEHIQAIQASAEAGVGGYAHMKALNLYVRQQARTSADYEATSKLCTEWGDTGNAPLFQRVSDLLNGLRRRAEAAETAAASGAEELRLIVERVSGDTGEPAIVAVDRLLERLKQRDADINEILADAGVPQVLFGVDQGWSVFGRLRWLVDALRRAEARAEAAEHASLSHSKPGPLTAEPPAWPVVLPGPVPSVAGKTCEGCAYLAKPVSPGSDRDCQRYPRQWTYDGDSSGWEYPMAHRRCGEYRPTTEPR